MKRTLLVLFFMLSTAGMAVLQESAEVSSVIVWVKALDSDGKAVRGLTAEDFEVFENSKKVTVGCFEEIGGSPEAGVSTPSTEPQMGAPVAGTRTSQKFVLFLDLYNTPSSDYLSIKPKLQEFFDQIANRKYEAMIAALTPAGKLGVVSPYTKDTARLKAILNQAKGNPGLEHDVSSREHQIVNLLEQLRPEDTPTDSIDDLTRPSPVREMNNQLMKGAYSLAKNFSTQDKQRSEFSMHALEAFAAYVAKQNANDHTVIIYISGGFNSLPGRRYFDLIDKVVEGRGFKQDTFVFALRIGTAPTAEKLDIYSLLQKNVGKLTRSNVTLYTINTRGIAPAISNTSISGEFAMDEAKYMPDLQEPLQAIADETGGLFFQNSRNFQLGFDRILDDLQHQYILCYTPPNDDPKAEYFKIKVVSKKDGVTLRYRKGYAK